MPTTEHAYWLAFNQLTKIGPVRLKKILQGFPSMEQAWQANRQALLKIGLENDLIDYFFLEREAIDPEALERALEREQIKTLVLTDPEYPTLLKEIYDPPPLLYYRGQMKNADEFRLAVVGTRKISTYGRQVTEEIVNELACQDLTIVSGLALGVDSMAHEATLTQDGRTIAVLGSGLDWASIYPHTNRRLVERIVQGGGAVISEFPLATLPLKHHFPIRNRIISGLSLGTLVIEADEESGSLITAKAALDQNREVFSVPGSIYAPSSRGTNQLIKDGAKLTTSAADILESLNLSQIKSYIQNQIILPDSPEEAAVIKYLSKEPIHIDELIRQSGLNPSRVMSVLTSMEMKGRVKNLGGMNYVLSR